MVVPSFCYEDSCSYDFSHCTSLHHPSFDEMIFQFVIKCTMCIATYVSGMAFYSQSIPVLPLDCSCTGPFHTIRTDFEATTANLPGLQKAYDTPSMPFY